MKHVPFLLFFLTVSFALCSADTISSKIFSLLLLDQSMDESASENNVDSFTIKSEIPFRNSAEEPQRPCADLIIPKDRFLSLLVLNEPPLRKKLYRSDLQSFHFEYITELEFAPDCKGFPEVDEKKLTPTERSNTKKYGKKIAQGYEAPWYVSLINEHVGHGAFADADIDEGQLIGEYTGIVVETYKSQALDMSYAWTVSSPEYCRDQGKFFFVDAKKAGNFVRFINHSGYPNVRPLTVYSQNQWHMVYVAARPIKKDEQLLVDYGAGYWHSKACKPVLLEL